MSSVLHDKTKLQINIKKYSWSIIICKTKKIYAMASILRKHAFGGKKCAGSLQAGSAN